MLVYTALEHTWAMFDSRDWLFESQTTVADLPVETSAISCFCNGIELVMCPGPSPFLLFHLRSYNYITHKGYYIHDCITSKMIIIGGRG